MIILPSPDRSAISRFSFAVIAATVAVAIYGALHPDPRAVPPLPCFSLAVVLAAFWGGFGPGLLAAAICAAAGGLLFLHPPGGWGMGWSEAIGFATFGLVSVGISAIGAALHRSLQLSREQQEEWRAGEHRWRELAESMQHLVWTCRPDGHCDFLSSQWVAYTGRPEAEQLGFRWAAAVHPSDREAVLAAWEQASRTETVLDNEFRIRRHDGEYRWFKTRAVPVRDGEGRVVKWYGSNTDVEDLKRAQAAAVLAAEQRMLAVEAADMGAWDWNLKTGALVWSDRAYSMFGVPKGEPLTRDRFMATVHPDDRQRVYSTLNASLDTPPYRYQCEYRVMRPDGSVRWLFGRGAAQQDPATGELARMVGITVDVTDRVLGAKELATALEAAEAANRAKDSFLASLSHELRTPLTPVLFLAASLERSSEVPDALRQDFAMIRRNIELEARLIDDLLDLTRITRGKLHLDFAPLGLHAVVQRSVDLLREELDRKQLALAVDLGAPNDEANADAVRLQQVFWNVLKNAVKFTPEGGSISVRSHCPGPHLWHLAIADTGLGITAEELPSIFDAFAQGGEAASHRFGGLGLGLAISSLLVQEHGGRIWATSAGRNQGATFHIEVPLRAGCESEPPESPAQTPTPAPRSGRLLIVEDHAPTRETLARLLTRRGFAVEIAETAAHARAIAAAQPFDLMISDLGLPDGSGHDLATEMQHAYGLKAIALSGYGMEEDLRLSESAGFLDHITKPADIDTLHDSILAALHSGGGKT